MTAQEFFEKNKGEYFDYNGEKVMVVGYGHGGIAQPIIISKKEGWHLGSFQSRSIQYIDKTLICPGDKFWFVDEEELTPIEQPKLDLCKLLEGCEGIELWSDIFGKCKLLNTKGNCSYKIEVQVIDKDDDENGFECFTPDGKFYTGYPNTKCMLWPSETNRDWSTFKKPIKIKEGDPVMTKWNSAAFQKLESYTKDNKSDFIVPVSDFDFTDFDSNKSKSIV